LATHVEDFLAKLHERQREVERAQSTSTSDPSAQEDLTEEGDMEIDSGDESSSQVSLQDNIPATKPQEQSLPQQEQQQQPPQQQQLPQPQQQQMPQKQQQQMPQQQQQQLPQQHLNAMAHTAQMFPNLLPTIQQQQQQQQQSSLMMSNASLQANNLLSVLPTHGANVTVAGAVRPSFTPLNVRQQPGNPMLQPLPMPMAAAPMNMSQQLHMPLQSSGQQIAPLPLQRQLDNLQMSINNIQQHQQTMFRNSQQHSYGQQHLLNHQQQTIGQQPAFSQQQQLRPMPVPVSNQQRPSAPSRKLVVPWTTPGQPPASSFSTPVVDHTPLFLKAARANATVNIAPQVSVPPTMPTSEMVSTQPSLAPLASVSAPELTYTASLKPLSSQPVISTSTLSVPVTATPLTTTVVSETTDASSTHVSSSVTDTTTTPTTTTPSNESQDALALASSLLPGVDTELLQSILQTVKIGGGNKGTTDDITETLTTTTTESSKPTTTTTAAATTTTTTKEQTPPDFDSDDMHVGGPNIVMFGERKRKPSNDEAATPPEENLAPDAKLAKVESRPPWLPDEGVANGPISSSLADNINKQPHADASPAGKFLTEFGSSCKDECTPSKEQPPYVRDLRPGYSYKLRSQSPLVKDQDLSSIGGDLSPEDFLGLLPIVKDYGHGHGPSYLNFEPDQKMPPSRDQESAVRNQSPAKGDDFSQKPFLKDQGSDEVKSEESSQEKFVKDQRPKDQKMFAGNQSPDQAIPPLRDQELNEITNQPPPIQGSQGLPNRDHESLNKNQESDQGLTRGNIRDWGPGQEPYATQRPHFRDQLSGQGPPFRDQGPHFGDQGPGHGPNFRDQGPHFSDQAPHFRDQRPYFRTQGPHYRGQGPYFRDQGPHFRGQGPHFRGQGPHFRDQGPYSRDGKGLPYGDHGLQPFRDQGPSIRGQGPPPVRGQGPPIRNQGPPVRNQELHIENHGSGQIMDQGLGQGLPARSQESLTLDQVPGLGSTDIDLLTAIDPESDQDLSEVLKNFNPSEGSDSSKDQKLDQEQPPSQGPPSNNQLLSHQQELLNDSTRDNGPNRNSQESRPPSSDQYHFTQVPPPDHYDRPSPDRYYSERPPWRHHLPAAGGPRMSSSPPPPFRHPGPRNIRFPPPQQDPHWQQFPPHHYAVRGPPRPSPYRQPY